jgi:uncharacterized protein YbjT (DUF2867 family)
MAIELKSTSLVTIYGGSGFVGSHIVRALARTGCRIRVAVRRPELAIALQPLGGVGQIHAVQANVRDPGSVSAAARGADALVNLVGILQEGGPQTFSAVQTEGARNVAAAAQTEGIRTLVHFSAIGADPGSPSAYARSKAAGEEAVLALLPEANVLRPSVVFGPEDQFFNRFAALARVSPVLPLIGGGDTRFQPVFVGDVAKAALAALEGRTRPGAVYELGGPEIMTLKEVFQRVLRYTGRRRLMVPLPFGIAKLQARLLQILPNAPLTVDQVLLLQFDNLVSDRARREGLTLEGLGLTATAADLVVPSYLERFRAKGQFSARRP